MRKVKTQNHLQARYFLTPYDRSSIAHGEMGILPSGLNDSLSAPSRIMFNMGPANITNHLLNGDILYFQIEL